MRFRVKRRKEPQVVLVSLVDVVLQLVIFFVLTSTFRSGEVSIDISLPPADAPAAVAAEGITVELEEDGTIRLDGEEVSRLDLGEFFRAESASGRTPTVLLRADRSTSHGEVVAVLDLARAHDMQRLSIAAVAGGGNGSH
jgi:biopolymer transport protein ExbD